jgi:phosphoglycolate phosphatase-like HAD superfamily hydrolase
VSIAVFDIDGVVADVRHRVHHVEGRQKHWGRFFDAAAQDSGSPEGIEWALRASADHELVWLTGRPEWLRAVTTRWLAKHGLPTDELIMRPEQDYRPARLLKVAALNRLADRDVVVFVDDDPQVVQAAAAAGFPAALADWMPRGAALSNAQDRAGRT